MEKRLEYIAYLHKEAGSDFGVSFPDFPGCITAGRTLDEARRLAPEALGLHIQGLVEDGGKIPKPSTLDELASDPNMKKAVAFLVSVDPPGDRVVRINLTVRESQIEKIDEAAKRLHLSRSVYMVQSALSGGARGGPVRGAREKVR
jgi:predicted RNase H-like HicB family nuclease